MHRFALVATLLVSALAGCTSPEPEETGTPLPAYVLEADGIPVEATLAEAFTFHLEASGSATRTSDHIGAHYWSFDTDYPTADFAQAAGGCAHVTGGGALPGTFDVTCTIPSPGTYYLRGHVRLAEADATLNFWTDSFAVQVA